MDIKELAQQVHELIRPHLGTQKTQFDHFLDRTLIQHSNRGLIPFTPYPTQHRLFTLMDAPRGIVSTCRQAGNSTAMRVKILHEALTISGHKALWVCGNALLCKQLMANLKEMHKQELDLCDPPEIECLNQNFIGFKNGSHIIVTTINEVWRNFPDVLTLNRLVIDDAEFLSYKLLAQFWGNIQKYLNDISKVSKVTLVSARGIRSGLFHDIWENGGYPWRKMLIQWWEIPNRDDSWATSQINTLGEDSFNQEYCGISQKVN